MSGSAFSTHPPVCGQVSWNWPLLVCEPVSQPLLWPVFQSLKKASLSTSLLVSTLQIVWPSFSGFAFASLCVWAFTYATLSERVSTVPRPPHHPACRQVSWAPPQVNSQPSCATVTQLTHRLVFPQVSQRPPSLASQLAFRPVPWTLRLPECRKVSRPPTMFACQLAFRAVQRRRHQPTCCQVFFHSPVL